jgi:hypothetical protein
MLLYAASENIIVLCPKPVNLVLGVIAQERFNRTSLDAFRSQLCGFDIGTPHREVSRMVDHYRLTWWEDRELFDWQGVLLWRDVEDLVDSHMAQLVRNRTL